jgi:hypothetical protein
LQQQGHPDSSGGLPLRRRAQTSPGFALISVLSYWKELQPETAKQRDFRIPPGSTAAYGLGQPGDLRATSVSMQNTKEKEVPTGKHFDFWE